MKTLGQILEGLLDTDFDITDNEALVPVISKEVFLETATIRKIYDGEVWVDHHNTPCVAIDTDRLKKFGIKKIYSTHPSINIYSSTIVEDLNLIFENEPGDCYFETYGNQILFKNIQVLNCERFKVTSASGDSDPRAYKFENVTVDSNIVELGRINKLSINAKSRFKSTIINFLWASDKFLKLAQKCTDDPNELPKSLKIPLKSFPNLNHIQINGSNQFYNYRKANDEWYCY